MRHINGFFGVYFLHNHFWCYNFISNNIIYKVSSNRTTKTHIVYWNRSRFQNKNIISATISPSIKIKQYMNTFAMNKRCQIISTTAITNIMKFIKTLLDLSSPFTTISLSQAESNNIKLASIMKLEQRAQKVCQGMISKIRTHIPNSYLEKAICVSYFIVFKTSKVNLLSL